MAGRAVPLRVDGVELLVEVTQEAGGTHQGDVGPGAASRH